MCANNMEPVKASDETDAIKASTTLNQEDQPSSISSSSSVSQSQYDDVVLGQLARQLEYYFSQANLEKDTYVETLRQLNDGYVPVSILTRFSKVQAFCPVETVEAITKAASDFSEHLEVVAVDTKTGKRVKEGETSTTIVAVGPISGKPLRQISGPHPTVVPTSPKSDVQNTIIIREVDSSVTEADVRALFDDEHCPPIQSLYLDFANCWFVTMDTESRDDMLYVMMQLRAQYLGDEPVKARLKSLVRTVDPSMPVAPLLSGNVPSYNQLPGTGPISDAGSTGQGNKKKQNKKRNNKNGSSNNNSQGSRNNANQGQQGKNGSRSGNNNSTDGSSHSNNSNSKKAERQRQPEPDFSPESFPALSDQTRKVEVVVDGMDAAEKKHPGAHSDASSTATTMSSSSSSVTKQQHAAPDKQPFGGYAAALLKAKPATPVVKKTDAASNTKAKSAAASNAGPKMNGKQSESASATKKENVAVSQPIEAVSSVASVKPPVWGGGRSFADVLRKEEAAV